MSLPSELRIQFNPSTVRPNEQPNIRTLVTNAWRNLQALRPSRDAVVYSHNNAWWHSNANDRREHITVWYSSRPITRVHIYRDGSVSLNPSRPRKNAAAAPGAEDEYDSVAELDEEDWDLAEAQAAAEAAKAAAAEAKAAAAEARAAANAEAIEAAAH